MIGLSRTAEVHHDHGTTKVLDDHVLQAVPNPHQSSGGDGGGKPSHGVGVDQISGAEHVEQAQQHHGCAAHDFDPIVDVGFILEDGQALVDGLGFGRAHAC